MVISSLVITLPPTPAQRARLLAHLADDPQITVGTPVRDRLPVVTETTDAAAGAALCEALSAHDGVHVDVVAIDFEEDLCP